MSHDCLQEEMRCEETHSRLKPPSVVTAKADLSSSQLDKIYGFDEFFFFFV